jgi:hypothetical protein
MSKTLVSLVLCTLFATAQAQFPPLEISLDDVQAPVLGTAEISVRAGSNWQNITAIRGSIQFDPSVIDQPTMTFWGLSHPTGAMFQNPSSGVLTYQWASLISTGPTLSPGDVVFTLQFTVTGGVGSTSAVDFSNNPETLFWANGFGWSGNNFSIINGAVTVVVGGDLIFANGFDPSTVMVPFSTSTSQLFSAPPGITPSSTFVCKQPPHPVSTTPLAATNPHPAAPQKSAP